MLSAHSKILAEQRDLGRVHIKRNYISKMNRYDERICSVLILIAGIFYSQAFIISSPATSIITSRSTSIIGAIGENENDRILTRLSLLNDDEGKDTDNNINNDDDEEESLSIGLPALGPAGTSSRNNNDDDGTTTLTLNAANATATIAIIDGNNNNKNASFVSSKFSLQYTCNVCEHRNRVIVSRMAYREGYVHTVLIN
ncbi:MAG: hypothetical protein ACI8RD_001497 [Bacillariaceae sp.]|jgi:hypothetical protein